MSHGTHARVTKGGFSYEEPSIIISYLAEQVHTLDECIESQAQNHLACCQID